MLAQHNDSIKEAVDTVYQLTQEERIRMECEAREDYYRTQRGIQDMLDESAAKIKTLTSEKESMAAEIQSLAAEIQSLTAELEQLRRQLDRKV